MAPSRRLVFVQAVGEDEGRTDPELFMALALALVLAVQAAAVPAPAPLLPLDFDLARYRAPELGLPGRACDRSDPSAITVCAPPGAGAYPLAEMARIFAPRRLVAEIGVAGNLTANVHLDSVAMDRGRISKRVLIGLRLPF